ncbi:polysaccharide lyase family 1 protein [Sporormia fimetaria CBS 119925]|uniref:Polysaccharide lyase family 1 protein n=1 Tax=Sporormia fimetaria CBS 119925 TaxID=1340428 RepID=A0A6A6VCQ5_9PLEO|nr:polysaccharide lyase family 1 protein [Sporormia fimetaria CBS 119925]
MQFFTQLVASSLVAGSLASAIPLTERAAAVDQLVGFGEGTTGGGSGAGVTVSSCSALSTAAAAGGVIKINGKLNGCGTIKVASNTSLLGVGKGSGLINGGFRLAKVSNVIIRNLELTPPKKADAIDVEASTNIWVDHCDLHSVGMVGGKDDYDGLFDAKRESDKITVSWTKFHDHWKGSLIGHSDSFTADKGKLRITYHHNSFINVNSRLPSLRFGSGHIYSSCFQDCPTSGINSRMGAKVLVEQSSFSNVKRAIATNLDSDQQGYAVEKNNIFTGSTTTEITQSGQPDIPYQYTTDPAASVCGIVASQAGTGVITF